MSGGWWANYGEGQHILKLKVYLIQYALYIFFKPNFNSILHFLLFIDSCTLVYIWKWSMLGSWRTQNVQIMEKAITFWNWKDPFMNVLYIFLTKNNSIPHFHFIYWLLHYSIFKNIYAVISGENVWIYINESWLRKYLPKLEC